MTKPSQQFVAQILVLVVLDNGFAHPLAQNPRAIHVRMQVKWAFVHADIGIFVELLQDDFGLGLVEQEAVEVNVEFVVGRNDLGDRIGLGDDVAPRAGLHLKGGVPAP